MNFGVIGLGYMGLTHLQALQRCPEANVVAVCSTDPKKLSGDFSGVQGNLGRGGFDIDLTGVSKYTDWKVLAADRSVEAVAICLPTDLHFAVAAECLSAGKHVLLEKPMGLSGDDECQRLIDLSVKHQRQLMVAQVLRFWPAYLQLIEFVGARQDCVTSAKFQRFCAVPRGKPWQLDQARSGGAVFDLLIHDIDMALHLFGLPVAVKVLQQGPVETIEAHFMYSEPEPFDVGISGGWLEADAAFSMSFSVETARGTMALSPDGSLTHDRQQGAQPMNVPILEGDAFQSEINYFVDCCRTGQPPERCLPLESKHAVEVALLLKRSRDLGGELQLCTL